MSDTMVTFLKSARGKLAGLGRPMRFLILIAFAFLALSLVVWAPQPDLRVPHCSELR